MQSTVLQFYHAACAVLMAHDVYSKQLPHSGHIDVHSEASQSQRDGGDRGQK